MELAIFDFDGTLTKKDSLKDFIIFSCGYKKTALGLFLLGPVLFFYLLRLIPNNKAKEAVIRYFFKGWDINKFRDVSSQYSKERVPKIVRNIALEKINWHKSLGHRIVIVTASIECYLKDWCTVHNFDLIATKLEFKNDQLTGNLLTKNCYGQEKAKRITEMFDLGKFDYIYAYGDSAGDKNMLALANEKYYKWKKI